MPTIPARQVGILAKAETVYNTDSVPTVSANGVRLADWSSVSVRLTHKYANRRDDAVTGSMNKAPPAARTGRIVELSFVADASGYGAAYSAVNKPTISPLMRACAHSETVVTTASSESVAYAPVS